MSNAAQLNLVVDTPTAGDLAGVELGVLPNGQAFLSARGVAAFCGVAFSTMLEAASEVVQGANNPRAKAIRENLKATGADPLRPYESLRIEGRDTHAYSDKAVIAFVMYFANDAQRPSDRARRVLGLLATKSLRDLVYAALGITTPPPMRESAYVERLLVNDELPAGYFSVFNEGAALILRAEREGLKVGHETVPDVSIGQRWGEFWTNGSLDRKHGARKRHPHKYPESYPQSAANGFIDPWIYPEDALPAFRAWLERHYLPTHFPKYLEGKVAKKQLPGATAAKLLTAMVPRRLPSP